MSETATMTSAKRATWVAPVTFPRVLRAEAIKLATLPSFVWAFVMAYAVLGGFGILTALARILQRDAATPTISAGAGTALTGIQGAQLVIVLVAAIFATTEFAHQTVQPSYLAEPRRLRVLASKAVLVGALSLVVGSAGATTALLAAAAVARSAGLPFEITGTYAAQLIAGAAIYLAAIGVTGLAIGALLRSTVGAIIAGLVLLNVLPLLVGAAPVESIRDAAGYLPSTAGLMILQEHVPAGFIAPWFGVLIACAWAGVLLGAAALVTRRTDA
ncbi:MAG: transporter permease [Microbacterium sp.]|nr:transporter permease [Microbacterium sp.]